MAIKHICRYRDDTLCSKHNKNKPCPYDATNTEAENGIVTCPDYADKNKHHPDYDGMVPPEIFDIEDSDEMAEMWAEMFGYGDF